jgi:VanZ family protein
MRFLLPLVFVAAVAMIDEFNQSFEPSRTGSIWDVTLDFSGGAVITAVLWMIGRPRPPKTVGGAADDT